jgi:hypothetical protein
MQEKMIRGWPVDPVHLCQGKEGNAPESRGHAAFIPGYCEPNQEWRHISSRLLWRMRAEGGAGGAAALMPDTKATISISPRVLRIPHYLLR